MRKLILEHLLNHLQQPLTILLPAVFVIYRRLQIAVRKPSSDLGVHCIPQPRPEPPVFVHTVQPRQVRFCSRGPDSLTHPLAGAHDVALLVRAPGKEAVLTRDAVLLASGVENKVAGVRRADQQDGVGACGWGAVEEQLEAATGDDGHPEGCRTRVDWDC